MRISGSEVRASSAASYPLEMPSMSEWVLAMVKRPSAARPSSYALEINWWGMAASLRITATWIPPVSAWA